MWKAPTALLVTASIGLGGGCKKKDGDGDGGGNDGGGGQPDRGDAAGGGGGDGAASDGSDGTGGGDGGGGTGGTSGFPSFALGVEYTEKGLGAIYGAAGLRWAKTRLEAFAWGESEPKAPAGATHTYDWTCPDALVAEYQAAGMTSLQSYMSPKNPWAQRSIMDVMPKPEHMASYRAWVAALFERYDGDGKDDMPGLKAPIRFWVVGGEWTGFWGSGNADDYVELLSATREAGKPVHPGVVLGTIPFMMFDVFEGDEPSAAEIDARLADPPPNWRKSTAGMLKILDRTDLYDYVNLHSLGDYTEIPPMLRWLRAELGKRGAAGKPIWFDDAFPIAFLVHWKPGPGTDLPRVYPVTAAQAQAALDTLVAVAKLAEPDYTPAMRWIRAEVATGVVKKAVTALGEGAVGIQLGNTDDWMDDAAAGLRHAMVNLIGASAMMGLVDVTHVGYDFCRPRVAGGKRPAYRNLVLLIEKLGPDVDGKASPAGLPPPARGYVYDRGGKKIWIVWAEDRVLQLPGETETPATAAIPFPAAVKKVKVTHAVTDVDAPAPAVDVLPARPEGGVELPLTSAPVFVEAAE